MLFKPILLTLALLLPPAMPDLLPSTDTLHGYTRGGVAHPAALVPFSVVFSMPPHDISALEARLLQISDPHSAAYGNWLLREEVDRLTAPSAERRSAVGDWLLRAGAACVERPHSFRCTANVSAVSGWFAQPLFEFSVVADDADLTKLTTSLLRFPDPQSLLPCPAALAAHDVWFTQLLDFPILRRRQQSQDESVASRAAGGGAAAAYAPLATIESLSSLYTFPYPRAASTDASAAVGVLEFNEVAFANQSDIFAFTALSGVPSWTVSNTTGPANAGNSWGGESALDTLFLGSLAPNAFWFMTAGSEGYVEWLEDLAAMPSPPSVISISFGSREDSIASLVQKNALFAAQAARGITFVASSGDNGAMGFNASTNTCRAVLPVSWPAACPWVTAVGATAIDNSVAWTPLASPRSPVCVTPPKGWYKLPAACFGAGSNATERVCTSDGGAALITSGGGFSSFVAMPEWQRDAVSAYLQRNSSSSRILPPASYFNRSMRAIPDVAALGHAFYLVHNGKHSMMDGTSASAPVFAAALALANAARVARGKPRLGFFNPSLYALASRSPCALTDITLGENSCGGGGSCPAPGSPTRCEGFGAAPGYDVTTGWGSPLVSELVNAAVTLPDVYDCPKGT